METEQNTSMEELKVDEHDSIKESSLEDDILGTQSLLMSDSDEEYKDTINKSPSQKISSKRILDSDVEGEANLEKIGTNNSIKINKKISALIDSDSEYETHHTSQHDNESEAEGTQNIDFKQLKQNMRKKPRKKSKQNTLGAQLEHEGTKKSNKKLKKTKQKQLSEIQDINEISQNNSKGAQDLIDSETDEEAGLHAKYDSEANNEDNNDSNLKEKSRTVRASAKKALDEMQAIQSEQQRLHREAHISIPYHKPKKHTLEEFLKRRTIIQPVLSATNASPVATVIQTKRLKMTAEELEEYAKIMEERAKEATEFFKSESESEEESFKENESVLDRQPLENQSANEQSFIAKETLNKSVEAKPNVENSTESHNNMMDEERTNLDGVQLTEDEMAELLSEHYEIEGKSEAVNERPSCSKVLITEVIELPKLDMNTIRISPVKKLTQRPSLNIKELLKEKNLSSSPSLSGDPNKLIDLETGDLIEKKPTGVENLMKRLMATVINKKLKTTETCSILSVENGKLEMSKINIRLKETKDAQKEIKPGAAYFELKKNLKEMIQKKRLDELNKKQEDELEYSKCLAEEDDYDEQNSNEEEEEEKMEVETKVYELNNKSKNKVILVDEEENTLEVEENDENEEVENKFILEPNCDEENQQDLDNKNVVDNNNGEDDNSDEDEKSIDNTQALRKSRIIKVFNDSDEEGDKDDIDFLKTQPPVTQPHFFDTQASQKTSLGDEETELMVLCSGSFDSTQKASSNTALMSQIPVTQNNCRMINDDELMELCSGTFDQQAEEKQTQTQRKCNKILSSDEEVDGEEKNIENKQKVKKLTKKLNRKKAKLGFSDDEDESTDEDEGDVDYDKELEESESNLEDIAEDEPETFVDYDSEENEILVQMTKEDKVKEAQNFVENEAQLSESEWGSADEDEKNLDRYDMELGDEDEFDRDKLQAELGKIHARKMLDEDIREVRKIQEMLFEDEEKDGIGRQRTFKWKNAESGFSLDDGRQMNENGDGNGGSDDEISEQEWRKIRYDREEFLKEQGLKPDSQDMSTILPRTIIPPLNCKVTSMNATKKLQIVTTKRASISLIDSKKSSPFLISKGVTAMKGKCVRGSFLVRDKETLNKLAGLTKASTSSIASSEMDDTAGTVSIKSIKPKNFVFATLTEEEHENLKRKADELLNSSNESGKNFMKKPKLEPRRDKCFIDQLL